MTDEAGALPRYAKRDLERFLACGILAHGFARVRCTDRGGMFTVAFSCKSRSCPSCRTRSMHQTAANLVDRVLPAVPMRHVVLTLPVPVTSGLFVRRDPSLGGAIEFSSIAGPLRDEVLELRGSTPRGAGRPRRGRDRDRRRRLGSPRSLPGRRRDRPDRVRTSRRHTGRTRGVHRIRRLTQVSPLPRVRPVRRPARRGPRPARTSLPLRGQATNSGESPQLAPGWPHSPRTPQALGPAGAADVQIEPMGNGYFWTLRVRKP